MVHYSNSSLGGALKNPSKNRLFALTFAIRLALTCEVYTVWGRIVGDVEAGDIVSVLSYRGEKNHLGQGVDVNFSWSSVPSTRRVSLTDPSHAEAGRLRRQAAAKLFFKVFDPGGSRVSACMVGIDFRLPWGEDYCS